MRKHNDSISWRHSSSTCVICWSFVPVTCYLMSVSCCISSKIVKLLSYVLSHISCWYFEIIHVYVKIVCIVLNDFFEVCTGGLQKWCDSDRRISWHHQVCGILKEYEWLITTHFFAHIALSSWMFCVSVNVRAKIKKLNHIILNSHQI